MHRREGKSSGLGTFFDAIQPRDVYPVGGSGYQKEMPSVPRCFLIRPTSWKETGGLSKASSPVSRRTIAEFGCSYLQLSIIPLIRLKKTGSVIYCTREYSNDQYHWPSSSLSVKNDIYMMVA